MHIELSRLGETHSPPGQSIRLSGSAPQRDFRVEFTRSRVSSRYTGFDFRAAAAARHQSRYSTGPGGVVEMCRFSHCSVFAFSNASSIGPTM